MKADTDESNSVNRFHHAWMTCGIPFGLQCFWIWMRSDGPVRHLADVRCSAYLWQLTQASQSVTLSLKKLVLPPSLTRTRGGLTLIQRRRNKSLEGTTVITNWDLPFVTFPNKKRQEVAKIAEIFLTPINIGKPEILLFLRPFSWRTESALHI